MSVSNIQIQMETDMATAAHDDLAEQRGKLLEELAGIGELRQGSLRAQYRKCGKPNCHCAVEGAPGHGPYWLLTWPDRETGKSRGRTIPADAIEATQAQIAEYQRLRGLVRELIEVSGRICDARLDADKPAAPAKNTMLDESPADTPLPEFLESGGIGDGHEVQTSSEVRRVGG